jgi:oxygen-independent coproporphyrinogen-3 oxidase
MASSPQALYIHIPFCDSICSYCDFPKYLSSTNLQKRYLSALKEELRKINQKELKTCYIGGGTPSSLSPTLLEDLLSFVKNKFVISGEFTLEANPENLSEEKIKILASSGINRVSLGVQTFNKDILTYLNRKHSKEDVFSAVRNLHKQGIDNINLDFIYGIKGMKKEDVKEDILLASDLDVRHVSFYALQIEQGTPLFYQKDPGEEDDEMADQYEYLVQELYKKGFRRYEVSNFAQEGYQSAHNLTYWHNEEYYAAGLGATSLVDHIRIRRTRNIEKYLTQKDYFESVIKEDEEDREFNYLMLNLRLEEGFSLKDFSLQFHKDFLKDYAPEIEKNRDFLNITSERVALRKDKLFILDSILTDLLHFKD